MYVYIPAGIPGATIDDRARYVIALTFAEQRYGDHAVVTAADLERAGRFRILRSAPTIGMDGTEWLAVVTGSDDDLRAYARALSDVTGEPIDEPF